MGDAVLTTLSRLPNVRFIITTLGSRGSLLVERAAPGTVVEDRAVLKDLLAQLANELGSSSGGDADGNGNGAEREPDCVTRTGVHIRRGALASTGPLNLAYSAERCGVAANKAAEKAAQRAAAMGADAGP